VAKTPSAIYGLEYEDDDGCAGLLYAGDGLVKYAQ
jgi:hypothetical protein